VLGQWISAKMYLGYRRGGLLECLREKKKKKGQWQSWAIEVFVSDFLHFKMTN
jgi:hypothetical protein